MSTSEPGAPDPGVPYGSGPDAAAADAEPTLAHETVAPPPPPPPVGDAAAVADAPAPLAIPGLPADRPELHVAAAFAGGFLLAMFLKRLAR